RGSVSSGVPITKPGAWELGHPFLCWHLLGNRDRYHRVFHLRQWLALIHGSFSLLRLWCPGELALYLQGTADRQKQTHHAYHTQQNPFYSAHAGLQRVQVIEHFVQRPSGSRTLIRLRPQKKSKFRKQIYMLNAHEI